MEPLVIAASLSTPKIDCDPAGRILIEGESYPENTFEFYRPLTGWVTEFLALEQPLQLDLALAYLNTGSVKVMLDLLELLDAAFREGRDIVINWHYDEENPRATELAEDFQEDLSLRFNLLADLGD